MIEQSALSSDQVSALEIELIADLNGDGITGAQVVEQLYNKDNNNLPNDNWHQRNIYRTADDNFLLSRETLILDEHSQSNDNQYRQISAFVDNEWWYWDGSVPDNFFIERLDEEPYQTKFFTSKIFRTMAFCQGLALPLILTQI